MAIILFAFGACVVVVYGWDRLCTMGRAPRTKETGCQRTPGFWGVTDLQSSRDGYEVLRKKNIQILQTEQTYK